MIHLFKGRGLSWMILQGLGNPRDMFMIHQHPVVT